MRVRSNIGAPQDGQSTVADSRYSVIPVAPSSQFNNDSKERDADVVQAAHPVTRFSALVIVASPRTTNSTPCIKKCCCFIRYLLKPLKEQARYQRRNR